MKVKRKALIGLIAASLVGVGTASAFVIAGAQQSNNQGTVDSVVYLEWGANSITDITNLAYGSPVYREVSVAAPVVSAGAGAYTATFTVTLANGENSNVLTGVTCAIANQSWALQETVAAATAAVGTPQSFTVTTAKTFYLKFEVTEEAYAAYVAKTATMGGTATFSYTAAPAA